MTKTWLLTWTMYGTWLPGDRRSFVGQVKDGRGNKRLRNQFGTPYESPNSALEAHARTIMKGKPVYLTQPQACIVFAQFQETVNHRHWLLHAVAVMANHVHVVLTAPDDVAPDVLLRDLKSYASGALNRDRGSPLATSWWTESGSKRERKNRRSILAAIRYVERQPNALLIWSENQERPA